MWRSDIVSHCVLLERKDYIQVVNWVYIFLFFLWNFFFMKIIQRSKTQEKFITCSSVAIAKKCIQNSKVSNLCENQHLSIISWNRTRKLTERNSSIIECQNSRTFRLKRLHPSQVFTLFLFKLKIELCWFSTESHFSLPELDIQNWKKNSTESKIMLIELKFK